MPVLASGRLVRLAFNPHLPRRTVRLRLTLLYGGLFLLSGAALLAITYVLVVHNTKGFIFSTKNGSIAGTFVGAPSPLPKPLSDGQPVRVEQFGTSGHVVKRLTPQQARTQARQAAQLQAQSKRQHTSDLHQLLTQSGIALAGMTVLSLVLGWLVAGRVLRPLRTITTAARDISATSLHQRLALNGPNDELKELGDTFDALLARLEAAFQAQRQFVANASHELRTPLARQRTLAQVALADPNATANSLREAHERVLASGAQQGRLIEALLDLTRGQAGIDNQQRVDLANVAEGVLQTKRSEAELRGVDVHSELDLAQTTGDPRLVERLIANLIDNALRHNRPGGRIEVTTTTAAGWAQLTVANTGPVIPEEAIQQLTQPFKRVGADRTGHADGVGLGLSIAQAIADAHQATLTIAPRPDGGLRVQAGFQDAHDPTVDSATSTPAVSTADAPGAARPTRTGVSARA